MWVEFNHCVLDAELVRTQSTTSIVASAGIRASDKAPRFSTGSKTSNDYTFPSVGNGILYLKQPSWSTPSQNVWANPHTIRICIGKINQACITIAVAEKPRNGSTLDYHHRHVFADKSG